MRRREWIATGLGAAAAACSSSGTASEEPETQSRWAPAEAVLQQSVQDGLVTAASMAIWQGGERFE